MTKNYKASLIAISIMFLIVAPKYVSNKQKQRNIIKNIDDSYKDFNEEDIILPLGFDNKIDMITWSMVNGKINDIPKEEPMKISEYVDIMIHLLDKDIYKNNLVIKENLPEEVRNNLILDLSEVTTAKEGTYQYTIKYNKITYTGKVIVDPKPTGATIIKPKAEEESTEYYEIIQ